MTSSITLTDFMTIGGADRIRTGDRGVADQCLSTWLLRQIHFLTYTIMYVHHDEMMTKKGMKFKFFIPLSQLTFN